MIVHVIHGRETGRPLYRTVELFTAPQIGWDVLIGGGIFRVVDIAVTSANLLMYVTQCDELSETHRRTLCDDGWADTPSAVTGVWDESVKAPLLPYDEALSQPITCHLCGRKNVTRTRGPEGVPPSAGACGADTVASCRFGPPVGPY